MTKILVNYYQKLFFHSFWESNLIDNPFKILILVKTDSEAPDRPVVRVIHFVNPDTNIGKLSMCFKPQIFFNP